MNGAPTIHASAVRVGNTGVLIRGASGSGKSSLALGLLTIAPEAAALIADDRVVLTVRDDQVFASAPESLAGLLEVRSVGIVRYPHFGPSAIHLVVDLRPMAECPRIPDNADATTMIEGVSLPFLRLPIGQFDLPNRVLAALTLRPPDEAG
ncbi:HPr kinase/phosphorylase [Bauldia sp.]|uniref:HPr kinase/phosphorylase n=1 Tax=Bauldia sp. TaxID=2575872 RepID=UPI003BAD2ED3